MFSTMISGTIEHTSTSIRRALPTTPFPRKYIHCVFDDSQDALQAFATLLAAGYNAQDIYILAGREYREAVERGQTLLGSLMSGDFDEYMSESRQGHSFLVMRIAGHVQMEQVRSLLAPYHAHLMKYIDTWTVTELIP